MAVVNIPKPAPAGRAVLLDSLRGWAALSVLVFHICNGDVLPRSILRDWTHYLQADRTAVLMFFVLSGYVIGLTNQEPWSSRAVREYGWRRFVRIYPIYLLAVALGWWAVPTGDWQAVGGHLFFLQDSDPSNPLAVPNLRGNEPLWSLHYEAFYYLCFLLWWRWPGTVLPTLGGSLVAACLATAWAPAPAVIITHSVGAIFWLSGLVLARQPANPEPPREGRIAAHILWLHSVYHFAPAALLVRGLGMPDSPKAYLPVYDLVYLPGCVAAVALAGNRTLSWMRGWHVLSALVAASGLVMILYRGKSLLETRWAWSAGFLLAGALIFQWRSSLGLARLAVVGGFSYALYVVHMPVAWFVAGHFPGQTGPVASLGALLLTVALVFPLAWWLECRFQPWLRNRLTTRRTV